MTYEEYMDEFRAHGKHVAEDCIEWIREWFRKNGPGCKAVVGVSGGKDSAVTVALCVAALGKDSVFGVLLPNGVQQDLRDSISLCEHYDIAYETYNIRYTIEDILGKLRDVSDQALINLPPRIRMCYLYAVSQTINGRVANTCNLSEDYVGYATKYGDAAGDFAPLKNLTSDEVIEIGKQLGVPEYCLLKPPADGLCGMTDEENLGFSYAVLNKYIRTGEIEDKEIKKKIDYLHEINSFKEKLIERYEMKD